jgi:hypothetical protein
MVDEQRHAQRVWLKGLVADVPFAIELLDPGVEAFSFTFGEPIA